MKTHLLSSLSLALLPLSAFATTRTWDGGGGDALFSNEDNWNPNGVPVNGDDLIIGSDAPATVTNDLSGRTFDSLTFDDGVTLAGNAFTLTGGIVSAPAGALPLTVTVSANVTLGANQTFSSGGTGSLRFAGSVVFGARTLTVTGTRTTTFDAITGGNTAGSRLIKTGPGMLRFSETAIALMNLPLDLTAGTLDMDGNLQAPVEMSGGKLTGEGNILGLTATAGDIEPDAGNLSVSGSVTLGGTSRCLFHLTGPGDGNTLDCTGASVTIQGTATMTLDAPGYTPVWDEDFQLLSKSTAGAIAGTFSNTADNAEVPLGTTIGQAHYNGGNGNDLTLDIFSTTRTWDGGNAINDNWDEAGNWQLNTGPNVGDVLVFPSGIGSADRGLDNNFPADTTFRQLVFNGDDYTVRGNRFRLSHGIELGFSAGQANLDTDLVLALDQTFDFNAASVNPADRVLHLDSLDEINTNGKTLRLIGTGVIDGSINGSGGVTIPGGPTNDTRGNIEFTAKNNYIGPTVIESDGRLVIGTTALGSQSTLGTTAGPTIVSGLLQYTDSGTLGLDGVADDEPMILRRGGCICWSGVDTTMRTNIRLGGGLTLEGFTGPDQFATLEGHFGNLIVTSSITGAGNLRVDERVQLKGPEANSFSGSVQVIPVGGIDTELILEKNAAGVTAISCQTLEIAGVNDNAGRVETREDEQIINTCAVTIRDAGTLSIGNVTARTETIGSLTFDGIGPVVSGGSANSNFVVTGNITQTGTGRGTIAVDTKVTAPLTLVNVAGSLQFNSDAATITRDGSAIMRKTGGGTLEMLGNQVSVPIQVAEGSVLFRAVNTQPIFLDGGNLIGNGTASGGLTSMPGGGIVQPLGEPGATTILATGPLDLNAATTLQMQVLSAVAGSGYDQLTATGSIGLGGATLLLEHLAGFTVPLGQSITLLANDGSDAIIGTFAGLPQGAFIPIPAASGGGGWTISYTGGTGNDVVLTRVPGPPENSLPLVTNVTLGDADQTGNRPVTIAGTGVPGTSYRLESSADLSEWTPEGPAQTAAEGTGSLNFDSSARPRVRSKQFWRIRRL